MARDCEASPSRNACAVEPLDAGAQLARGEADREAHASTSRPASTPTRRSSRAARAGSWVTSTMAAPLSATSCSIRSATRAAVTGSRLPVGSSADRRSGPTARARALAPPGLPEAIEAAGTPLVDTGDTSPDADALKARDAAALYRLKRPALFTIHLSSLDEVQHATGPGSPQSHAVLERIDAEVGTIVEAARAVEPDVVVAIVSDPGCAPGSQEVDLGTAFVQAGLIRLDAAGKPVSWDASPWASGGSAAVVLARRDDPALRARVAALLARLAADPASGVLRVIDRDQIARMGGAPDADFFVDGRDGYSFASKLTGPLVRPIEEKGSHGFFPDRPQMRATLILNGPGVPVGRDLGEVDMRAIAPTLAGRLGVALPSADLPPLF